jgi:hypothetical protein
MTANQLRVALRRLGFSQLKTARMFGYQGRAVRHWIAGDTAVPVPIAIILRLLLAGKTTEADISDTQR